MAFCPSCHSENPPSAAACVSCGAPLAAEWTAGHVVAGRYEVLGLLGRGGMGAVYKAYDRTLDETVALKVLRSDLAHGGELHNRFRSEIRLARRVTHRNVCRIHEYGEDGPHRFISMAFVEGVDLRRVLKDNGPLAAEEAFAAAIGTAEGLAAIHEEGIVHRDLKTANLMRDARGTVRVMDFGIAKPADGNAAAGLTATGMIVGTPEYMSPEQARGDAVDARSDVYALGIVVFELFTGRVPFRGETPIATILKHLTEPPPLDGPEARRLPLALIPVLRKALAKDRDLRYRDAGEVAQALRVARDDVSTQAMSTEAPALGELSPGPRTAHPLASPPVRGRRIWPIAIVGLASLAAVAAWAFRSVHSRASPPVTAGASGGMTASGPQVVPPAREAVPVTTLTTSVPETTPPAPVPPAHETARETRRTVSSPRPRSETPRVAPVPTTMATAAPRTGLIRVHVIPWGDVSVDGAPVATEALRAIRVPEGPHVVRIVHPDYQPVQRRVTVTADAAVTLTVDLAEEAIRRPR